MQTINISTPSENLIVSENGNQPQQSSSELEKLLTANMSLAVWLIFLGIGGGLLARYYIRIGYLPEMEWNAALVYLFVCSVWGSVIGLVLTISLYLPGVIWSEIIVFETPLDNHLTSLAEHDDTSGKRSMRKEPCIRSIMRYLGIPFLVVLLASHLCLRFSKPEIQPIGFYWVFAVLILVRTFFYMRGEFRRRLVSECPETLRRQIFRYSIWFTISVLLNQIAMYVIYILADRTSRLGNFIILTGICTAGVWLSTNVVAVRHRYYPRQALVAALVMAVLLLFWVDRYSDLSMKLMNRYGVGEGKEVIVVVNEKGTKTLEDLGFTKGTWRLEKVNILSKMGDHYFLKLGAHSFTLPKSEVESIHRYDPDATTR
jgi:hypothetical protein